MSKIIGLTGGIGSGKTTVAKLLEKEGFPVYYSDEEAKKILQSPEIRIRVIEIFGSQILNDDQIDRKKLANIVFQQPEKLKELNAILHPAVKKHFDEWVAKNVNEPFLVKEAAILFESGAYKYCDFILTIVASEAIRIQRVMERDQCSKEAVVDRMKNQWTDSQRVEKSDFVIENENLEQTQKEISKFLKKIKNLQ